MGGLRGCCGWSGFGSEDDVAGAGLLVVGGGLVVMSCGVPDVVFAELAGNA